MVLPTLLHSSSLEPIFANIRCLVFLESLCITHSLRICLLRQELFTLCCNKSHHVAIYCAHSFLIKCSIHLFQKYLAPVIQFSDSCPNPGTVSYIYSVYIWHHVMCALCSESVHITNYCINYGTSASVVRQLEISHKSLLQLSLQSADNMKTPQCQNVF